jgi:hypothetical protein
MNTFLVERYLPGASAREVLDIAARIEAEIERMNAEGVSVRYLGSTFIPSEESCFCRFEGPSPEAVARLNQRAAIPFARIMATLVIEPGQHCSHPRA